MLGISPCATSRQGALGLLGARGGERGGVGTTVLHQQFPASLFEQPPKYIPTFPVADLSIRIAPGVPFRGGGRGVHELLSEFRASELLPEEVQHEVKFDLMLVRANPDGLPELLGLCGRDAEEACRSQEVLLLQSLQKSDRQVERLSRPHVLNE